jgi:hypothetical protein
MNRRDRFCAVARSEEGGRNRSISNIRAAHVRKRAREFNKIDLRRDGCFPCRALTTPQLYALVLVGFRKHHVCRKTTLERLVDYAL